MAFWTYGPRRITEKTFPDGSKNIWGFEVQGMNEHDPTYQMTQGSVLTWKWESDADLTTLMLLKKSYPNFTKLRILYLPYGREDRDRQHTSNCPLRHVGQFIQSLGFESIQVFDPHSDLTLAYLGTKAFGSYPVDLLRSAALKLPYSDYVVMFPDAGAAKRYGNDWSKFSHIIGTKFRDMETGKLSGYTVNGGEEARGKKVLIVDDICSYGGTFMLAGNALRPFEPAEQILVVTHCEDSIHKGDIFKQGSPINHVVTTDSLLSVYAPGLAHPFHGDTRKTLTVIEMPK